VKQERGVGRAGRQKLSILPDFKITITYPTVHYATAPAKTGFAAGSGLLLTP
jgi:hypothetical protein